MNQAKNKSIRRQRRKTGIRKSVLGSPQRPRLTVFKSLKHMYAQVIDDLSGRTLASASTVEKAISIDGHRGNAGAAAEVGRAIAQRSLDAGLTQVVFDRNGFRYHGRVKALADAARETGLQF